ncbi:MAG: cysteine desulfurase [Steroidobacteraceae bacterium]
MEEMRSVAAETLVAEWRNEFPILRIRVRGKPLVYLDNAATTQKPRAVIDAVSRFYARDNANVHRGVHALSQRATDSFEAARARVQGFLHAAASDEIIFVRGATEAINLVAQSFARPLLVAGDEILVSAMEHHSNIVPWQQVCRQTGAVLKVVPIDEAGEFVFSEYECLLGARTRLVAVTHVSNALGSVTDIARITALAHARGVPVLVDGAQAIAHLPVDVRALDCDFYVFSGHKCFGPTGIGVLYGKRERLEAMPPWQAGGDMVRSVSFDATEYMPIPHRFEAGTPDISGAIGLGAALDFVSAIGLTAIAAHEQRLLDLASVGLERIPGIRIVGTAGRKASILSFVMDGVHAHDIGSILDRAGIAIRTGHHCAMPAMQHFGLSGGTARASFAFYNTLEEVERFVDGVRRVYEIFQ